MLKIDDVNNHDHYGDCLLHKENEWEIIKEIKSNDKITFVADKLNGKINKQDVKLCTIEITDEINQDQIKYLIKLNEFDSTLKFYGYGKDENNKYYIYMEYLENSISINDLIKLTPNHKFDNNSIKVITLSIYNLVIKLYKNGINHGAINCDNIILIYNEVKTVIGIKLINFNISNQMEYLFEANRFNKPNLKSIGETINKMLGNHLSEKDIDIPPSLLFNSFEDSLKQYIDNIFICLKLNDSNMFGFHSKYNINISTLSIAESYMFSKVIMLLFNKPIKTGSIPYSVFDLTLSSYNQILTTGSIPSGVIYLTLSSYNQILSTGSIPDSVTKLTLSSYNQILSTGSIPDSVTKLTLSSYNQILSSGSIPDSVRHLTLSSYNQILSTGSIPNSVAYLTLSSYNQILSTGSIPNSVINLTLSSYNQILSTESIPNSVTDLTFSSYNQILSSGSIPNSVRDLTLSSYNQILLSGTIPKSIDYLNLISFFCSFNKGVVPISIQSLKLSSVFHDFKSLSNLSPLIFNKISPSIESLIANKEKPSYPIILNHTENDWIRIKKLNIGTFILKKNGCTVGLSVDICISKKFTFREFCVLQILENNSFIMGYYGNGIINNKELIIYKEYNPNAVSIRDQLKLQKDKRFNENEIINYATKITQALKSIHDNKIVHGNFNCDHILILPNQNDIKEESIKIIGFGSSLQLSDMNNYTHDLLIGDETHMAPEVKLRNGKASFKSDIWSLGCTLIEMSGGDVRQLDVNGVPLIPTHLSNNLRNIIQQCLIKNQDGRFDANRLLNRLDNNFIYEYYSVQFEQIVIGYLDIGDEDIQINDDDIDSSPIIALKCGYKFTEILNQKSIPSSVTNLQLTNYNLKINKNSIPSTVISLSLGSNFNELESLSNLPSSIINLNFSTTSNDLINITKYINSSITHLVVNGKRVETLLIVNSKQSYQQPTLIRNHLIHLNDDWVKNKDLGKGAFGTVYLADNKNKYINNVQVDKCVIKKIEKQHFNFSEVSILEQLNNLDYSFKYYGCGIDNDGFVYIYMEYVENFKSIADILKISELNEQEIKSHSIEIVKGLKTIHQRNIVHRDIKGEHILLIYNSDGERTGIKFIDFGLSKQFDQTGPNYYRSFVGTESHIAPEVKLQNGKASYKSDIYCLGCTFIEMAGGDLDPNKRNEKNEPIIPDHLSCSFKNIIQNCIAFDPNARPDLDTLLEMLSGSDCNKHQISNSNDDYPEITNELKIGMIKDGIKNLSLSSFNGTIQIGSIPSSVTHLSFKIFNQEFEFEGIPESVKYLDLGDEFDIQSNGDNLPIESILTLKCGYQFNKILKQITIPSSVTNLQLTNYNLKINKNSIPSTVTSLTLGTFANNDNLESLSNLPSNVNSVALNTTIDDISKICKIIKPSVTSLFINGQQQRN